MTRKELIAAVTPRGFEPLRLEPKSYVLSLYNGALIIILNDRPSIIIGTSIC